MTALLLSFPRSGNHFVRFIAEYITGRPTKGCSENPSDIPIHLNMFPKPVLNHVDSTAKPVFQKSHGFPEPLWFADQKLVFILRDYRECITRHVTHRRKRGILTTLLESPPKSPGPGRYFDCLSQYLEVLRLYDNWSGSKFLVSYEELITESASVVRELSQFMGWDPARTEDYIKRKDELFEMSLSGSGRSWAGSKTLGKNVRSHYKEVDPAVLEQMKSHIERFHPELTFYLSPYGIDSFQPAGAEAVSPVVRSGGDFLQ